MSGMSDVNNYYFRNKSSEQRLLKQLFSNDASQTVLLKQFFLNSASSAAEQGRPGCPGSPGGPDVLLSSELPPSEPSLLNIGF